jgi:hypothetical protein
MRLSMLEIVKRTAFCRCRVLADLEAVREGKFRITIDGEPQDGAMMAIARPAIESELNGRLASLNRDLDSYGVKVDDAAPDHAITVRPAAVPPPLG